MIAHASPPPDLFWEPAVGSLVMLRPAARTGVAAEDEHPLLVREASDISGARIFSCETTGPVTARRLSNGRIGTTRPTWTCFMRADDLIPYNGDSAT